MARALITTVPFGKVDPVSLQTLDEAGIEYVINPIGRRLTEEELISLIPGFDILIAGTEPITERVMKAGGELKLISRVGVGLDNVDLLAARSLGIAVAYTPEGPADAVAELTIGLSLSLLRGVHLANAAIRQGVWNRFQGQRLGSVSVGVVGVGRIGRRVIRLFRAFGAEIYANDLVTAELDEPVQWVDKPTLFKEVDLVTLHVPLTQRTRNLVDSEQLASMKPGAFLINTCRGGVVNEAALVTALRAGQIAGAAIDTFVNEPYHGDLVNVETCLITTHMGSMAADCRVSMECGAALNAVAFLSGKPCNELVPNSEYELRRSEQKLFES
tara:strand:- start:3866 stop:4852 length:987 start_codon:yes stop_codon:yes gene_type:complete